MYWQTEEYADGTIYHHCRIDNNPHKCTIREKYKKITLNIYIDTWTSLTDGIRFDLNSIKNAKRIGEIMLKDFEQKQKFAKSS